MNKKAVSITIDKDIIKWLDGFSNTPGYSRSELVNRCLYAVMKWDQSEDERMAQLGKMARDGICEEDFEGLPSEYKKQRTSADIFFSHFKNVI